MKPLYERILVKPREKETKTKNANRITYFFI